MKIKWNERELQKLTQGIVQDAAKEYQRAFDSVLRSHQGQPVNEIKPVLQSELKRAGMTVTEPELTEWATCISEGKRVELRTA